MNAVNNSNPSLINATIAFDFRTISVFPIVTHIERLFRSPTAITMHKNYFVVIFSHLLRQDLNTTIVTSKQTIPNFEITTFFPKKSTAFPFLKYHLDEL